MTFPANASFGLFCFQKSTPVPLKSIDVKGSLIDPIAEVVVEQKYVNEESVPIEAIYRFPVYTNAAVRSFSAFIDGKEVQAIVKEKEAAKNTYDDAIASGHGAYLLEKESDEVFVCNVGNLPPNKEVLIKISYVAELTMSVDSLVFVLPTTIAPKYQPQSTPFWNFSTTSSQPTQPVHNPGYYLSLDLNVEMSSPIREIESPTHSIRMSISDQCKARVTLSNDSLLDKDFVLRIKTENPNLTRTWVEHDKLSKSSKTPNAAMLCFYPKFENVDVLSEIVFVVDQSGSMSGLPMEAAKRCLQLFLRSLPETCLFNIIGFGYNHYKLFPMSSPYNNDTLTRASHLVNSMSASLGGTEILSPLKSILEQPAYDRYARQILLLTDGEVTNTEEVITYVRKHSSTTRVFTFGVGTNVSHHLIKGVAKAGNGASEFIGVNERMEAKVMKHIAKVISPSLTSLKLKWLDSNGNDISSKIKQAPSKLPPVFDGSLLTVYGLYDQQVVPSEVVLETVSPNGNITWKAPISDQPLTGNVLHTVAARAWINELEDDERIYNNTHKKEIIEVSCTYSVSSKYTAFVAVEKREDSVEAAMEVRNVPNTATGAVNTWNTNSGHYRQGPWALAYGAPSSAWDRGSSNSNSNASGFGFGSSTGSAQGFLSLTTPSSGSFSTTPSFGSFSAAPTQPTFGFGASNVSSIPVWGGASYPSSAPPTTNSNDIFQSFYGGNQTHSNAFIPHHAQGPNDLFGFSPSPQQSAPLSNSKMQTIIQLQKADGSWDFNSQLFNVLGLAESAAIQKMSTIGLIDSQTSLWATCLAIACLKKHFGGFEVDWSILATKAIKWIHRAIQQSGLSTTVDKLIESAKEIL